MELVGRMLDGSIPYDPKGALPRPGLFGDHLRQDEKIEHLQRVPLLSGCTQRQLRSIARIAEVREVPAGTVLTRTGEPGEEFFVIIDGKARVEVSARKRVRLRPGDFFGEMSMLDGGPRSATVVAETALRLLVIKRRDFSLLLSKASDLTRSLLTVLSQRVRQAEQALNA
ncbi:MAG: hypothetical protein AUH29_06245 [Candidatus Rokubacteria bacterium 13_1_40CM_69_27]|nr:MAG: hypothetical protein AUH29_06245 [Candidatus Rokubacteria bacterium 13_1_40CM_69_27]OLE39616.1 MAG: hypothetical protein AUG00_01430 [Candidatus Rokubacteria bacterium 13_1_20CM_2_70_7]